jgi:hypothetical protein
MGTQLEGWAGAARVQYYMRPGLLLNISSKTPALYPTRDAWPEGLGGATDKS